jgi:hypothetical protein
MVCVGALDGFADFFPSGTKILSAMASASAPEMRKTARPPSPRGVAMAAMVSSRFMGEFSSAPLENINDGLL